MHVSQISISFIVHKACVHEDSVCLTHLCPVLTGDSKLESPGHVIYVGD